MSELQAMVEEAEEQKAKKGGRKRAQTKAAKEEPEMAEAQDTATEEVAKQEEPSQADEAAMTAALVLQLTERIKELESRLQPAAAPVTYAPNPARRNRRHIMVWRDEFTMIQVEVPDDYDGPGLDGTPVKGYLNYEHSQLRR